MKHFWQSATLRQFHENYQVGVPFYGKYKKSSTVTAKNMADRESLICVQRPASRQNAMKEGIPLPLKIPALGVAVFSCTPGKKPEKLAVAAKKPETAKKTTRKAAVKKDSTKKVAAKKGCCEENIGKKTTTAKKTTAKKNIKEDIAV